MAMMDAPTKILPIGIALTTIGLPMDKIRTVMSLLERDGCLPQQYNPHRLSGDRKGQWECHIQPNWLLIWEQHDKELILILLNTGTHSDLFGKTRRK